MQVETDVVTGAFGYIGKYVARQLLASGRRVKTITTHPNKENPFGDAVTAFPFNFHKPDLLMKNLQGSCTLYNTYWIRFEFGGSTFKQALENTETLFKCAKKAGVKKIVHISVTQASEKSFLSYYRGKGLQEKALIDLGIPYSIIRPTVVYGKEDILINNIAWQIRKFPIFPIFGTGEYRVQPIYVEDLASIAIESADSTDSLSLDAVGPETFSFKELVQLIASKMNRNVKLIHVSPSLGIFLGRLIGLILRDVVLTKDELKGLMDNLLCSKQTPNGKTRFSDWLVSNADNIGGSYSSELERHFRWRSAS